MRDLLTRLLRALPAVEAWVSELHAKSASRAVPANATPFTRLREYFPTSVLENARAVTVDVVPFPPVASLGLPEFEALASMPMTGITFGRMYFVLRGHEEEPTHFHELVHVVQWSALGAAAFLQAYAVGIAEHGYEASPLEFAAFDVQARFERGEALPGLVEYISWHAERTREAAADLFRSCGMTMAVE